MERLINLDKSIRYRVKYLNGKISEIYELFYMTDPDGNDFLVTWSEHIKTHKNIPVFYLSFHSFTVTLFNCAVVKFYIQRI